MQTVLMWQHTAVWLDHAHCQKHSLYVHSSPTLSFLWVVLWHTKVGVYIDTFLIIIHGSWLHAASCNCVNTKYDSWVVRYICNSSCGGYIFQERNAINLFRQYVTWYNFVLRVFASRVARLVVETQRSHREPQYHQTITQNQWVPRTLQWSHLAAWIQLSQARWLHRAQKDNKSECLCCHSWTPFYAHHDSVLKDTKQGITESLCKPETL